MDSPVSAPSRSPFQPLPCEVRPERAYSIAQVVTPHGVCAVLADAPPPLIRAMVLAAHEAWLR